MGEQLVGAGIALVSAAVGSIITHVFEERRRQSEEKRWLAEYYMDRKVKSINELWMSLLDSKDAILRASPDEYESKKDFQKKISDKVEKYRKAKLVASVYIAEKEMKLLNKALGALKKASLALFLNLPDDISGVKGSDYSDETKSVNYELVLESSKKALEVLQPLLNPEILKEYDELLADKK